MFSVPSMSPKGDENPIKTIFPTQPCFPTVSAVV